jgi:hypothetical protein
MIGDARTPMFARSVVGVNDDTSWQPNFTIVLNDVAGYVLTVPQVNGPVYKDYGSPLANTNYGDLG